MIAFLHKIRFFEIVLALIVLCTPSLACTSFVITPGASADGSMYVGHTNDGFGSGVVGHELINESTVLAYVPAADHPDGALRAVWFDPTSGSDEPASQKEGQAEPLAYIPEVKHTYGYFTGSYGIINEHQLMSGEVTDDAKIQPNSDPDKRIFYSSELSNIALERCRTAKEAVILVGQLIDKYGFYGTGETLLFADPGEAWVIEMAGGTPDGTGGLWAAQKIPDGEVFVTANTFRIREIIPGNSDQMYSSNLYWVAEHNGWWNQSEGKLDWLKTVSNGEYAHPYYSLARVWSLYSRIAPSRNYSPYVTDTYSKDYPFSVVPDKKLSTADAFSLFRNHYEGTVYDLTKGPAAGPFGNPYRWRGPYDDHNAIVAGEVKPGAWPRAVSEIFCGYSYITQGRNWLPDPIGGIVWFGFAQPAETVYIPFYDGATSVPAQWSNNDRSTFSHDYAWWAYSYVTNWATLNYRAMIGDINARQQAVEQRQFANQPVIEEKAKTLYYSENEDAAREYLTAYGSSNALANLNDWWKLSDNLVAKYSNMMVSDFANDTTTLPGYPDEWLEDVRYQYGPRIYEYDELQDVVGLAYVNMTVYTTPGNELNLIKTTQRKNLTEQLIDFFNGRIPPIPAQNVTRRIMKPG